MGILRATRLGGEVLNAGIRSDGFYTEKRKELSRGLHSTILLYRPDVSSRVWSMCKKVPRHAGSE
jgi:hypothetical protein